MKQLFFISLFLFSSANSLYPQLPSDIPNKLVNLTYSEILIKCEAKNLKCLVFSPADSSVSTGLILIHEEWGLTDWVTGISSQIADQGYLVVAPDLLSALITTVDTINDMANEEEIRTRLLNASHEEIKAELDASFDYLKANPLCNGKIAIIGFSWGGTQAFRYLTENTSINAGFVFYGRSPDKIKELERIKSPVYGIYGEYDTPLNNALGSTIRKMNRLGKVYQAIIIKGGGHGFMRSGEHPRATEDNTKARTQGWNKLLELINQI